MENVEIKMNFFKDRRQMQIKYLREIKGRFNLPMAQFPLMQDGLKGLGQLKHALIHLGDVHP